MNPELLYLMPSRVTHATTLISCLIESADNWSRLEGLVIAMCQRTWTGRVPGLDIVLGWQSEVVTFMPEVSWNKHVKVDMIREGTFDKPNVREIFGTDKVYTLTLKGKI